MFNLGTKVSKYPLWKVFPLGFNIVTMYEADNRHINQRVYQRTVLENFQKGLNILKQDDQLLQLVEGHNEWFLPGLVRRAIQAMLPWFESPQPEQFFSQNKPGIYPETSKHIGIIMAGNLPLVGLHDLLMVLLAGHRALVRTSTRDSVLIRRLVSQFHPGLQSRIAFRESLDPQSLSFLIATGSNNTARYLKHQFVGIPKIIRGNRYSVAVLNGEESAEHLNGLAEDILLYHGMGCRSVSNLLIPKGYRFDNLLQALNRFPKELLSEAWYRVVTWENAIRQMEFPNEVVGKRVAFWKGENLKTVPVGVVNLVTWEDRTQLEAHLTAKRDELQCIVGRDQPVEFGRSQHPGLADFADGINSYALLVA